MKLPEIPDYIFHELIGEGACGFVYRCTYRGNEARAVKILKALAINPGFISESFVSLVHAPRHPGILTPLAYDLGNSPYFCAYELMGGRDPATGRWRARTIEDIVGALPVEHALALVDQLIESLAFLHKHGICHAGIKSSNLFIAGDAQNGARIRVGDVGQGFVAGLHYMELGDVGFFGAPEQLANGDFTRRRGYRWDVYSFGVVAYQLLTGRLPRLNSLYQVHRRRAREQDRENAEATGAVFEEPGEYVRLIQQQAEVEWPTPPESELEASRRYLIETCLRVDPRVRFADMREVLELRRELDAGEKLNSMRSEADSLLTRERKFHQRWRKGFAAMGILSLAICATLAFMFWRLDLSWDKLVSIGKGEYQPVVVQQPEKPAVDRKEEEKLTDKLQKQLFGRNKEIEQAESLRMAAEAEAAKARETLELSQTNADVFFNLILSAQDSDLPGFPAQRSLALERAQKYYIDLIAVYANDPQKLPEVARAHFFLGSIAAEDQDWSKAAEHFSASGAGYSQLFQSEPESVDFLKGLALSKRGLANAALHSKAVKGVDPGTMLKEAVDAWASLVALKPDKLDWKLELAEDRLKWAEWYRSLGDDDEVVKILQAATDDLVAMQEKNPDHHKVLALLGRAFGEIAEVIVKEGNQEDALALRTQARDLLQKAVEQNGAVDRYQYDYALNLRALGELENDVERIKDAGELLEELMIRDPDNLVYALEFADLCDALSQRQRDSGESAAAVTLQKRAQEALFPLVDKEQPANTPEASAAMARRSLSLGQLQIDASNFGEALELVKGVIATLSVLHDAYPEEQAYLRTLAEARGLAGYASEQNGNKDEAKALYAEAVAGWEQLAGTNPGDEEVNEGLSWSKRQLEGLQ